VAQPGHEPCRDRDHGHDAGAPRQPRIVLSACSRCELCRIQGGDPRGARGGVGPGARRHAHRPAPGAARGGERHLCEQGRGPRGVPAPACRGRQGPHHGLHQQPLPGAAGHQARGSASGRPGHRDARGRPGFGGRGHHRRPPADRRPAHERHRDAAHHRGGGAAAGRLHGAPHRRQYHPDGAHVTRPGDRDHAPRGRLGQFVRWPFIVEGLLVGLAGAVSRSHCCCSPRPSARSPTSSRARCPSASRSPSPSRW